MFWGGIIKEG